MGKNQDKSINETRVSSTSTDWSIQSISIKLDLPIFIDISIDKSIPIFIDWLTPGAIHSTKIPTGPTGKSSPPQKVDQFFRNFSYRIDPMSFETKFSEVLIEWMAPEYLTAHCSSKPTSKRLLRRLVSHSTSMQIFFLQRLKRLLNQRWRFSDVYIRHDKRCISSNLQNYPRKQRVTS